LVGIIFRAHLPATAPVFVADAPVLDPPWLGAPIASAQIGHRAFAVEGKVLNPLLHLLYAAAADIAADIRLTAKLLAQIEKLVGAKVIILSHAAPVRVDHG